MARVIWKPVGHDKLLPYKCRLSGREDFNDYDAHYQARRICRDGTAEYTIILQDGQVVGRWERTASGEAVQTEGRKVL